MTESPGECESVAPPRAPPRRPRGRARQQDAAVEAVAVPADAAAEQERGEPLPAAGGGGAGPGAPPRPPPRTHGFQQYVFKKHCPCELCRQLIAGNSRQGLRCKACKAGVHLWCSEGISHQQCPGKTATSFRRNFSSPLLLPEQGGSAQGEPPPDPRVRVDPVYEALRFGTSLAHGAGPTELPPGIQGDKVAAGEESGDTLSSVGSPSGGVDPPAERDRVEEKSPGQQAARGPARRDGAPMFSYVALYKFVPQEQQDLALHEFAGSQPPPGRRGRWATGSAFFPANFVQRVRPGESVWRSCRNVPGDREQGRLSLRENQICVGVGRTQGLVRVTSGRKRGLVPAEALTEI
ncbi:unnamed protein product [Bubo scandiacus]